ncbi:MAG TPA: MucB/RseB C-terminal domain-containing protein [Steroidobacteraceae bacterium]
MKRAATWFVACLLVSVATVAQAQVDEARWWLERMSDALATRNYDGLFTHSSAAGQAESMRIVHRVDKGRSSERLVSLDGSGREVVRTRDEVHAYLPDRKVVLVEPRGDDGSLLKALPTPGPSLDRYYELKLQKGKKLLGRDIVVIDVRPRDAYRYGYRLWLDEATAMPLRSVVGDDAGRQLEQILFTRLEMKDKIPAKDVEPAVDATGFQWIRTDRKLAAMPQLPANNGLRPLRLPPGFRLVASRLQVMPGSPMPAHHLIFSDGIAAISVFIEPGPPTGPRPPEASSMGSASAYSTSVHGHVVTAIGEVPPNTVREIANSVAPMPPASPTPPPAPDMPAAATSSP